MKATDLANVVFEYLNDIDDKGLAPFIEKFPSEPFETRKVKKNELSVLSYLPKLKSGTNSSTSCIFKQFQSVSDYLYWGQTYSAEDFGETFLNKYGWAELIGLRGPIVSEKIACGFLLLGPDVLYPKHSHEAEEVYIPLSSDQDVFWVKGDDAWVSRAVGRPIYHKSGMIHGMKTSLSPLLALYVWYGGDLAQKSKIY
ncbi:MAG: transcriptional regulator [Deltaproteobacteria bacterium]|uniref:dimethylsulfonioproprionate lyase family protein n=1 Tax=Desulfobacula sp. TaxID=2593537 RepID=UPI0019C8525F|nr:transcriptional regulator [Candidatus Desulfobacula maris]MBL6994477.1 transcriptional regulator [Desulfobacula sp.]